MTLPLGMQLVHGTRIIVDSNPPAAEPLCDLLRQWLHVRLRSDARSCSASMKKGQNLVVQAINSNGAPLTLPLPLAGEFAKAYDGPPTGPEGVRGNPEEAAGRAAEARRRAAQEARRCAKAGGAQANPAAK